MAGPVSTAGGRRYKAFLSYGHRDAAAGDWLHRAIESYAVPKALVLLCHEIHSFLTSRLRMQHGHRGNRFARATAISVRTVEIEFGV